MLINNAGVMQTGPVAEIPMENVRRNFETNVFGTLALTQGFARQMVKRGSGEDRDRDIDGWSGHCAVRGRLLRDEARA